MPSRRNVLRLLSSTAGGLLAGQAARAVSASSQAAPEPTPEEASVQRELDERHRQGGGVVRLAAGTYPVRRGLVVRSGVTLLGEGYGTELRAGFPDGQSWNTVSLESYGEIASLRINGNDFDRTAITNGICGQWGHEFIKITRCWVHDCSGYAIVLWPGTAHCIVSGNHVWHNKESGIELFESHHNTIEGNVLRDIYGYPFFIWQGASYNTIVGNTVVDGHSFAGIKVYSEGKPCRHNTIIGNTVKNCGPRSEPYTSAGGLGLRQSGSGNIVTGNTIDSCRGYGIDLNYAGTGHVVSGNVVTDSTLAGLRITKTRDVQVSGNIYTTNATLSPHYS